MSEPYVAATRQITGDPYAHYGYAVRGKEIVSCGHKHRSTRDRWGNYGGGASRAQKCAERLARRLNTAHSGQPERAADRPIGPVRDDDGD
jgi:hypothetical protein